MLLSGLLAFSAAKAQEPPKGPEAPVAGQQLVRLSKITVDPARLAGYNAFYRRRSRLRCVSNPACWRSMLSRRRRRPDR